MNYYPYLGKGGFFAADPVNLARRRVGVWGACHGRFHLPGGERTPRVRPAAWQITPEGRTTAIGPLQILPTDEQPTAVTTFGDAARAFPDLEVVRSYTGLCVGTSGAGALRFQGVDSVQHVGSKHRHPCAVAPIRSITSLGRSATGAGPAVGAPTTALAAAFPASMADARYAEFDGVPPPEDPNEDPSSPTLWRTAAILARGHITGFYTRLPDHW